MCARSVQRACRAIRRAAPAEHAAMFAEQHIGGDGLVAVAGESCRETTDGGAIARRIGGPAAANPRRTRTRRPLQSSAGLTSSPQNSRTLSAPGSPMAGKRFRSFRAPATGRLRRRASRSPPHSVRMISAIRRQRSTRACGRMPPRRAISCNTASGDCAIFAASRPTRRSNSKNSSFRRVSSIR